ncbi:tautomerase family protein [Undibacterium sp. TJN25]|uniref:tautomerase family protein n=1 Tax=Undibacterium sp. TJN25 TaxID=3413056 RepID=UPI003BF253F8
MPIYQFTVTEDSISARKKAAIAEAITATHCEVTGAPSHYVSVVFIDAPKGNLFLAGKSVSGVRMVGTIRRRSEALKRELLTKLAQAWSDVTGEPLTEVVMFLVEVPGFQVFEGGELLREAEDDPEARV